MGGVCGAMLAQALKSVMKSVDSRAGRLLRPGRAGKARSDGVGLQCMGGAC